MVQTVAQVKGSVALVAAQASLNMVYTRTTFQVLGYKGQRSCVAWF